jgi:hypothetical protein
MTKGDSLDVLKQNGLNTPIYRVFRTPFNREKMISSTHDFPGNISVRTWAKGKVECPFYPNQSFTTIPSILDYLFESDLDEIIFSQGIDPSKSERCGRVSHLMDYKTDNFACLEYFEGPGTVRDLDKKDPAERFSEIIPYWGWKCPDLWKLYLMSKCRPFFGSYPLSTLEWSLYNDRVGRLKDTLIFWEVL